MKEGDVYQTLRHRVERRDSKGIDYAVIGAKALVAHGYRTEDVGILLTPRALELFRKEVEGLGYLAAFGGAKKTFRDTRTRVKVEIMTTGEYPGDGKPKPVAFPDATRAREKKEGLWVLELTKLIELKLASGLTAPHRLTDLADTHELILHLRLPWSWASGSTRAFAPSIEGR